MEPVYRAVVRSVSYYESRAEEVRTIAEQTGDPWCHKALLMIATDFERLALDRRVADQRRKDREARW